MIYSIISRHSGGTEKTGILEANNISAKRKSQRLNVFKVILLDFSFKGKKKYMDPILTLI